MFHLSIKRAPQKDGPWDLQSWAVAQVGDSYYLPISDIPACS